MRHAGTRKLKNNIVRLDRARTPTRERLNGGSCALRHLSGGREAVSSIWSIHWSPRIESVGSIRLCITLDPKGLLVRRADRSNVKFAHKVGLFKWAQPIVTPEPCRDGCFPAVLCDTRVIQK